jgi:hypothetical protein
MKKLALSSLLALALTPALFAADQKFQAEAVCAKCELQQVDKCQAALQLTSTDGKKETILVEQGGKAKELHSEICKGGKAVNVEGAITEKEGKKTIKISSYEIR